MHMLYPFSFAASDHLPRYNEEQRHRHDVRPGPTGYAQAHGRNAVTWEDKFKMDVWYTRNVSFKTDWDIFWATVRIVLKREGISSELQPFICQDL